MDTNWPTIKREFLGGSEDVSFDEFCDKVIQDYGAALSIVQSMMADDHWNYVADNGNPEYVERYSIIDIDRLKWQVERAED